MIRRVSYEVIQIPMPRGSGSVVYFVEVEKKISPACEMRSDRSCRPEFPWNCDMRTDFWKPVSELDARLPYPRIFKNFCCTCNLKKPQHNSMSKKVQEQEPPTSNRLSRQTITHAVTQTRDIPHKTLVSQHSLSKPSTTCHPPPVSHHHIKSKTQTRIF